MFVSTLDTFLNFSSQVDESDQENFTRMVELWFQFCMIWSICCTVDEEGRKKIDTYIREMEGTFPNKDSIYEYYVDPKGKTWVHFEEKLKHGWKYNPRLVFNLWVWIFINDRNWFQGKLSQVKGK